PKEDLEALGIDVIKDLPGVGQNLQDHLMVPVAYYSKEPVTLVGAGEESEAEKFAEERKGMLTSNIAEAGGFVKLNPDSPAPELQFHLTPVWFILHGAEAPEAHGYTMLPGLVGSKSSGHIKLRSADPNDPPIYDPNYLAEQEDMDVLVEGVKLGRKIMTAPAYDDYRGEEYLPGETVQTDEEIQEFVRNYVQNIYHPVGTCKMGNDGMAVVNDRLQVHGIDGLRVADASVMPVIINANTNNPCIMIGEKCADMILNG
ncbi:MAG: GMC oxidoreductase, partial [Chloroflexota bacterium]